MEKQGRIKNFFGEFKKFITRGNVLDMSVGVIVGGAFTGIVNGLSNYILKPIINWLIALVLGKEGLSGAITMLSPAYKDTLGSFYLYRLGIVYQRDHQFLAYCFRTVQYRAYVQPYRGSTSENDRRA